jgi:tetratricopeptide (TPR) repeat protein
MMKSIALTISGIMISGFMIGQTLQEAIKKTENERMEAAASDFRSLIAKDPTKGEYYFYFGENYFKNGDVDSANMMYNKGVEVNATNPLNYVGLGKVLLSKNNVNEAKTQFYKATSIGGAKNAEVMRQTAEAWLTTDHKEPDAAIALLTAANKIDPKNAEGYILLGDAQLEKNPTDGSAPILSYQKASSLDPKNPKGILRQGRLYQRARNYNLALDYYKKAIELDPKFAPAYRQIAELYSMAGQHKNSIENWKKYLELNDSEHARYRFMSALFFNKQYPEAITEYENLKKSNFSNVYLERLAAYSYAEQSAKDSAAAQKGLAAMDNFVKMAGPNFKYIADDYRYKGRLLASAGKDSLALIEMQKAIVIDSTKAGAIYGELAEMAGKKKNYLGVATYLEKKKGRDNKNLDNNDWFDLGKAYYWLGQAKTKTLTELTAEYKKKKKSPGQEVATLQKQADSLFVLADTSFSNLVKLNPSWPVGYVWRGRANYMLDPDAKTDNTKTQFEKVIATVKPEEQTGTYKNYVVESYEYLGYYYVTKKDEAKAKEAWLKVKELDPGNKKAEFYLNPPKPKTQAGTGSKGTH